MEGAKAPRLVKGLPAYFTPDQLRRLLSTIETDVILKRALKGAPARNYLADLPTVIRLSVETGLRQGELLHLRRMDVDLAASLLHVRAYEDPVRGFSFQPKDSDRRVLPLSPVAYRLLDERARAAKDDAITALVFPGRAGRPRDGKRLSRTFKGYVRQASLPENLHFHSLRHTFASYLASSGTPIITLQRWLGHAKIEQTMKYADLLPSALAWRPSRFHEMIDAPDREPALR